MKVLVVDDSKTMRMIIVRTLKKAGFSGLEVVQAENGVEGLKAVAEHSPTVVLSDWNMPEMNGIDFLQKLRDEGNTVTFGFVTTETTDDVRSLATDAGASFFITKPFTVDKFEAELSAVLA